MNPSRILLTFVAVASLTLALGAQAQENRPPGGPAGAGQGGPGGPGGPGGRGRGEGRPMPVHPVVAALDANGDGVISAEEIANAPAALKKLDKNGDGKLTEDEIRPAFGRGGPGASSVTSADLVKRMLEFDKNGDGKLSKDELPERMQGMLERADTDKDGTLSKEELTKMAEAQAAAAGAAGGPGRGGREGREGERRPQRPAQPE